MRAIAAVICVRRRDAGGAGIRAIPRGMQWNRNAARWWLLLSIAESAEQLLQRQRLFLRFTIRQSHQIVRSVQWLTKFFLTRRPNISHRFAAPFLLMISKRHRMISVRASRHHNPGGKRRDCGTVMQIQSQSWAESSPAGICGLPAVDSTPCRSVDCSHFRVAANSARLAIGA